jgi:prophage regulatory protein
MLQKILKRPEVQALLNMPRSSIYAGIANGTFPKPIQLEGRAVGWLEHELITWQKRRIAERDAPAPKRRRRAA